MRKIVILAGLAGLAFAPVAHALDPSSLAKEVEAQTKTTLEAVDLLRQAMIEVSGRGQYGIRRALFIQGEGLGFGVFTARANSVFAIDEKMIVYIEPIGIHWIPRQGYFQTTSTISYQVRTEKGQVIAEQSGAKVDLRSRHQNQELMYQLDLDLKGGRPGKYVLAVEYKEDSTGQTATFELPFEWK